MKKTTTPIKTPSPHAGHSHMAAEVGQVKDPRTEFISATLTMSWQLAIVVLVPIIGGYELDKKLHMTPILTIVGFILAMIGMGLVVWYQFQLVAPLPPIKHKGRRQ